MAKQVPTKTVDHATALRLEKLKAARAVMGTINSVKGLRETQKVRFADEVPPYRRISTGILSLDLVMGGRADLGFGYPRGLRSQVTGADSCYKTTSFLTTAAGVQRDGGLVVWFQAEEFDKDYARSKGVVVEDVVLINALTGGDVALEQFVTVLESGVADIAFIDSIQATATEKELEETDIGEGGYGNGSPYMWGQAARRIARAQGMDAGHTAVVWASGVRTKVGNKSQHGDNLQGTQIHALMHSKCIDIYLRKGEAKYTDKDGVYGRTYVCKALKNKTDTPELDGSFDVYYRDVGSEPVGYDLAQDVLNWGVFHGVIASAGAFYTVNGQKFQGKAKLKAYLRENPEVVASVIELIHEAVHS